MFSFFVDDNIVLIASVQCEKSIVLAYNHKSLPLLGEIPGQVFLGLVTKERILVFIFGGKNKLYLRILLPLLWLVQKIGNTPQWI